MHEFSVMNNLVNQVHAIAADVAATRVVAVHLRLGALAHISPDHLADHFAAVARGTIAQDAELVIEQSTDIQDPYATDVVIERVEVEQMEAS